MLPRRCLYALATTAVFACGGGGDATAPGGAGTPPPPPPMVDPRPASVVLVDASAEHSSQFVLKVTLHLRNEGGAGVYKVDFWAYPTEPGGGDTFLRETEAVEVTAGYEETLTYTFETENLAKYVVLQTRKAGSTKYRQTASFDFPAP